MIIIIYYKSQIHVYFDRYKLLRFLSSIRYYSDDNDEDITTCTDNKNSSSESLSSSFERSREDACRYKENIHYTEKSRESFQPPMLRKYLPMYQRSELIEELKEHDRMRLIREKEAVRCVTSNPLDSRKLSFASKMQESQTLSETFVDCDREKPVSANKII